MKFSNKPDPNKPIHREIKQGTIYIYDQRQTDALATFVPEVIEFKLKQVTQVYRVLINSLIGGYEKLAYWHKEAFIEFLPKMIETQKLKDNLDQPPERPPQNISPKASRRNRTSSVVWKRQLNR